MIDHPQYHDLILGAAKTHQLNPLLIAAVIHQESGGRAYAMRKEEGFYQKYIKPKRTRDELLGYVPPQERVTLETERGLRAFSFGLMQIMGQTAREAGFASDDLAELLIPSNNIAVGCRILRRKLEVSEGDQYFALLRYNGGANEMYPDQVLSHIEQNRLGYLVKL